MPNAQMGTFQWKRQKDPDLFGDHLSNIAIAKHSLLILLHNTLRYIITGFVLDFTQDWDLPPSGGDIIFCLDLSGFTTDLTGIWNLLGFEGISTDLPFRTPLLLAQNVSLPEISWLELLHYDYLGSADCLYESSSDPVEAEFVGIRQSQMYCDV